jgi:hypothetical protein
MALSNEPVEATERKPPMTPELTLRLANDRMAAFQAERAVDRLAAAQRRRPSPPRGPLFSFRALLRREPCPDVASA